MWECEPDPTIEVGNATTLPAPATTPGVVNYFPDAQVAAQANTDCTGGEGVSPGCAGGTTLSTEDNFSGSGEDMGEAVPTSTATTVEGANAADEEPSHFKINTAGGTSSQSACTGSDCIHKTGGGTPRDGAGPTVDGMGIGE